MRPRSDVRGMEKREERSRPGESKLGEISRMPSRASSPEANPISAATTLIIDLQAYRAVQT